MFIASSFGVGAGSNESGTTLVVPVPTGTADGDMLVAIVASNADAAGPNSVPTGWTNPMGAGIVWALNGTAEAMYLYYKTASSEPADYTWGYAASGNSRIGGMLAYRGDTIAVALSSDGDKALNIATGPITLNAGALMTDVSGNIIIYACCTNARESGGTGPAITVDAALTTRLSRLKGGSAVVGNSLVIADELSDGTARDRSFVITWTRVGSLLTRALEGSVDFIVAAPTGVDHWAWSDPQAVDAWQWV